MENFILKRELQSSLEPTLWIYIRRGVEQNSQQVDRTLEAFIIKLIQNLYI